jgi:periplasmic protein TonB
MNTNAKPNAVLFSSPITHSQQPTNYLWATLLLAVLFHGVLIIGVTFSAEDTHKDNNDTTYLDVVIINSSNEKKIESREAQFLAERSLINPGNNSKDSSSTIAYYKKTSNSIDQQHKDIKAEKNSDPKIISGFSNQNPTYNNRADLNTTKKKTSPRVLRIANNNLTNILIGSSKNTLIKSSSNLEDFISANTQKSLIANYLQGWKRKVERIGTINFPATRITTRDPILEVALAADGTLQEAIIVRSSGQEKLDQAAINILNMSAPFDSFPSFLKKDVDVLRFSYEWSFTGEALSSEISLSEKQ